VKCREYNGTDFAEASGLIRAGRTEGATEAERRDADAIEALLESIAEVSWRC
jgi:hypothetical protein